MNLLSKFFSLTQGKNVQVIFSEFFQRVFQAADHRTTLLEYQMSSLCFQSLLAPANVSFLVSFYYNLVLFSVTCIVIVREQGSCPCSCTEVRGGFRGVSSHLRDQTLVLSLGRVILRAQLFSFMKLDSHRISSLLPGSFCHECLSRLIHATV